MTNGTITFSDGNRWRIVTKPHVASLLRRLFISLAKQSGKELWLSSTPANAQDVLWILERYPHDIDPSHMTILRAEAAVARERQELGDSILNGYVPRPSRFNGKLRDYQEKAVQLLLAMRGIICADDLGLGKTLVGIGALSHEGSRPAVIVCPGNLQLQWREQIKRFLPGCLPYIAKTSTPERFAGDILIITYTKLHGWAETLAAAGVATVIMDEGHELRDCTTQKYQAALAICNVATQKLILTATPVTNYAGEIFNLVQLVRWGEMGEPHEFRREWGGGTTNKGDLIVENPQALGSRLRELGIMIRRTREEVGIEMPPLARFAEEVPYDEKILSALKDDMLQLAEKILHGAPLEKGQAAREMDLILRQATGIAKAPYAANFINALTDQGHKVLVGVWHREVYDILNAKLTAKSWMYSGSESDVQKNKAKNEFLAHEGGASMLMSLRSGAGLDGLQEKVFTVVFVELDWSHAKHNQFIGRAHRPGQLEPVTAFFLVADAGSDPIVAQILGVKLVQGEGITNPELEAQDLKGVAKLKDATPEELTRHAVKLAEAYVAEHRKDKQPQTPQAK